MDIDGNALLLSFAIGGAGFVCFAYGKKQGAILPMIAGLVLLVFPYFVSSLLLMAGIAIAVLALLAFGSRYLPS
jgi:hypothetical protein